MGVGSKVRMRPFGELVPREEAMRLILENIKPIERVETILLEQACGRVVSRDVEAGFDVPPFDRASMDGYAVRAGDTRGAPVTLREVGEIHAGMTYEGVLGPGECLEIATGSPIPEGADAVVKVEDTQPGKGEVLVRREVAPGENVAKAGEDISRGEVVVEAGTFVTPGVLGALAALGLSEVEVYAKPRVAIYSSGPEIAPQGQPLKPGQVYDINSYTVSAVVEANGGVPLRMGIMEDSWERVEACLKEASKYDLAVFSGGSSVGVKDLLARAVEKKGRVYFHGVKTKPGKPTLFGEVGGVPVFGMPGYPTSCLNNAYVYLLPALRKLARLPPKRWVKVEAPLAGRLETSSGREQFITVRLEEGKAYVVYKKSGDITSMTHADGYITLPPGRWVLEEGETVEVTLLHI